MSRLLRTLDDFSGTVPTGRYQLFPPLRSEEYEALKADIRSRGALVAVEYDEAGNILDGHHRVQICEELGITFPRVTRIGLSEEAKREHVVKLNMCRRHLDPVSWAEAFESFLEARGSRRGQGARNDTRTSATVAEVAAELGVAERTARDRLAVLALPDDRKERVRNREIGAREAKRKARQRTKLLAREEAARALRAEPLPPPTGPFGVIVIDPPWRYVKRADDDSHRARVPYPDMSTEEISALPVPEVAEENAVVWLWTTNAFMWDAGTILRAWGFSPKTILTWAKDRVGVGDWLRGQTEHCILATRGRPLVMLTTQTTLLPAPAREHSRKPEEFYRLVESLCPGPKLDWFSREARPGWTQYGNELEKFGRVGDSDA